MIETSPVSTAPTNPHKFGTWWGNLKLETLPLDRTRAVPAAADPFRPVLEALQRLEQEDPQLASQGARLLGLFRRMWESCAAKHFDSQRLEDMNQDLRAMNANICREGDHLKHRQDEQLARFYDFEESLDQTRQDILDILKDWDSCTVAHLAVLTNAIPRDR
ncbi:hypothetical protein N7448_011263 [Penicillium atrosanguineum]|nr:hypothetical protein N7448_011263 [Penicillium atrosanguineum]